MSGSHSTFRDAELAAFGVQQDWSRFCVQASVIAGALQRSDCWNDWFFALVKIFVKLLKLWFVGDSSEYISEVVG